MPKFTVDVWQEVVSHQRCEIEVEADDELDARIKATDMLSDYETSDRLPWRESGQERPEYGIWKLTEVPATPVGS